MEGFQFYSVLTISNRGSTDSQNPLMRLMGPAITWRKAGRHVVMHAFDQWWEWARIPVDSKLTIPTVIHNAVRAFPADDRRDHLNVNDAQRPERRP
jgi:hypothetical protein